MKRLIKKIKKLMKDYGPSKRRLSSFKEVWIAIFGATVVLGVVALAVFSTINKVAPEEDVKGETEEVQGELRHPLTGEVLEEVLETLPQVFGVMVENSADAWPLAGIDEAFLVIEAPVEGTIPRFITFFHEESGVAKIGPVRSARPYYLDWNDELDAVYAHIGGSPEALDMIKYDYDTIDLNQFWQSEYFYRQTTGRYAPHNVFTTSGRLKSALNELELDEPNYEAWKFKDDYPIENPEDARSIRVDFAGGTTYDVEWRYDGETNQYIRYQGRTPMRMENGFGVTANNVIVIATDIRSIDSVDRKKIVTVGEGDGLVIQDGISITVRWRKEERTTRLRFFTKDGEEVKMNAGKTWIEIVSTMSQVR